VGIVLYAYVLLPVLAICINDIDAKDDYFYVSYSKSGQKI